MTDKIDKTLRYPKNFPGFTSDIDGKMKILQGNRDQGERKTLSQTKNLANVSDKFRRRRSWHSIFQRNFYLDSSFKNEKEVSFLYEQSQGSLFTKYTFLIRCMRTPRK